MSLMTRSELKKLEKQDLVVDENARFLARCPEAIRLLREWVNEDRDWPHGKTVAFLATEPTEKGFERGSTGGWR